MAGFSTMSGVISYGQFQMVAGHGVFRWPSEEPLKQIFKDRCGHASEKVSSIIMPVYLEVGPVF